MFSLNSANSVTKILLFLKDCWARTHYLLCEKQRLYHCATDTQLTEKIDLVKFTIIHASVSRQIL